jgi:hypothetical protein
MDRRARRETRVPKTEREAGVKSDTRTLDRKYRTDSQDARTGSEGSSASGSILWTKWDWIHTRRTGIGLRECRVIHISYVYFYTRFISLEGVCWDLGERHEARRCRRMPDRSWGVGK